MKDNEFNNADPRLIVFLKIPRLGGVKTRLAQTIGDAAALEAYRRIVDRVVGAIADLPDVELRFTPQGGAGELEGWLKPSWSARPQGGGDLGDRLSRAFSDAFAEGASRVVAIGSDCPYLTSTDIENAWNRLLTDDLVLGPSLDGGYWLIGLRQFVPELFRGIHWSTDWVFSETRQVADRLGLRCSFLRSLSDVDTAADWDAFLRTAG